MKRDTIRRVMMILSTVGGIAVVAGASLASGDAQAQSCKVDCRCDGPASCEAIGTFSARVSDPDAVAEACGEVGRCRYTRYHQGRPVTCKPTVVRAVCEAPKTGQVTWKDNVKAAPTDSAQRRAHLKDRSTWRASRARLQTAIEREATRDLQLMAVALGSRPTLYCLRQSGGVDVEDFVARRVGRIRRALHDTGHRRFPTINLDRLSQALVAAEPSRRLTPAHVADEARALADRLIAVMAKTTTRAGKPASFIIAGGLTGIRDVEACVRIAATTGRRLVLHDVDQGLPGALAGAIASGRRLVGFSALVADYREARSDRQLVLDQFVGIPQSGRYILWGRRADGRVRMAATVGRGRLRVRDSKLFKSAGQEPSVGVLRAVARLKLTSSRRARFTKGLPPLARSRAQRALSAHAGQTLREAVERRARAAGPVGGPSNRTP